MPKFLNTEQNLETLYHSDPIAFARYRDAWAIANGLTVNADTVSDIQEAMFAEAREKGSTVPKRKVTEKSVWVMSAFMVIMLCVLAIGLAVAMKK